MAVQAKFRVLNITRQLQSVWKNGEGRMAEVQTIKLLPVTGDSPENEEFFASTPSGTIELGVVNAAAAAAFGLGAEFYVTFTPAS